MAKDEEYEKGVVKGNMVYKIHWTDPPTLMPVETMCGRIPHLTSLFIFLFFFKMDGLLYKADCHFESNYF